MLKKALFSIVLLGMLVTPLFAQQVDNVEKALRFRVKAPEREVVVQSGVTRVEEQKDIPRISAPLKGSNAQLENLGGFIWNSSNGQLQDLGGFIWNSSKSQLEDLGGYIWNNSDSQLEDLGGYIWNNSDSQLEDLGGYIWNNSDSQLQDLGGFIWNSSKSQLEDLGGYIWAHSGSQLKDLGCPYCNRGNQFSAGQLEDLGPSGRPPFFSASQLEDLGQSRYAIAFNPAAASLKPSVR
jgi:hypothetical protein